jgi:hypothetical protein
MTKFRGIVFEVDKDGAKCVSAVVEGDDRQVVEDHTNARGAILLSKAFNVETMVEELDVNGRPITQSASNCVWDKTTSTFKAVEPPQPITLADQPRKFLKSRAARLVRLIELDAPAIVIEGEFRLIEQAMVAFREKEGDKRAMWDDAARLHRASSMSTDEADDILREVGIETYHV